MGVRAQTSHRPGPTGDDVLRREVPAPSLQLQRALQPGAVVVIGDPDAGDQRLRIGERLTAEDFELRPPPDYQAFDPISDIDVRVHGTAATLWYSSKIDAVTARLRQSAGFHPPVEQPMPYAAELGSGRS